MKTLLDFTAEAHSKVAHHITTFSMDKHHENFSAEPALLLQMIEVTLDHMVTVTGIIDSGFQVIIIHKDIWERLGTPMKHKQVMFMESANGQSNATMGMIPSICFSIREVSLHCQVQVVKEAPFKCLLSLPFTCLASTNSNIFWMEVHIFFSQTPIQVHLLLSQPMPKDPAEIILLPVIMKGIFNCQ